jgi:hypothetical protein
VENFIFVETKPKNMTHAEIKNALLEGKNFGNEASNWYSLCKPSQNRFWIVIQDRNIFCKNIESAAKRISQLIKRGY